MQCCLVQRPSTRIIKEGSGGAARNNAALKWMTSRKPSTPLHWWYIPSSRTSKASRKATSRWSTNTRPIVIICGSLPVDGDHLLLSRRAHRHSASPAWPCSGRHKTNAEREDRYPPMDVGRVAVASRPFFVNLARPAPASLMSMQVFSWPALFVMNLSSGIPVCPTDAAHGT